MQSKPINRLVPHWPKTAADDAAPVDAGRVVGMARAWRERVEALMGDHPQATILAAAAAGVLLGWVIKRK